MGKQLRANQDRLPDEVERLRRENLELRFHNLKLLQHIHDIRDMTQHVSEGVPPVIVVVEYKQPGGGSR